MYDFVEIKERIINQHNNDKKQLEVIFSNSSRVMVEAPAGYGKTTTMISRIAYLFVSRKIPNPKRLLGLTFSVNAALKIKREVAGNLPRLIGSKNNPITINEKITITNFHGFCKNILKKYGYLISSMLKKDINYFYAVGEMEIEKTQSLKNLLTNEEKEYLKKVEENIKKALLPNNQEIQEYNEIIIQKLLPTGYVTHNAIILFVLEIFIKYDEIKKFYQNYYKLVIVDEFQDTNCIAWELLTSIITDKTQLLFLGDPLQRIYGFIGALPNIMVKAMEQYKMQKIELSKNYRFCNNLEMLKLDKNIRENAKTNFSPEIKEDEIAQLPAFFGKDQFGEVEQVIDKVQELLKDKTKKIAILFRSRNKNVEMYENVFLEKKIPFFYGLFTDEDEEYIKFHRICQEKFIQQFGSKKTINKNTLIIFTNNIKKLFLDKDKIVESLLILLDAFVKKILVDYSDILPEDKYAMILDVFENRQMKQAMEYVDSRIILSTIHGAKGLEWDYVFLCDVERWIFPSYLCKSCENMSVISKNYKCVIPNLLFSDFKDKLLEELSIFYVGITRAKKQIYISASATRFDKQGREMKSMFSCMSSMKGIKLVKG